jgi:hypothetical protein
VTQKPKLRIYRWDNEVVALLTWPGGAQVRISNARSKWLRVVLSGVAYRLGRRELT